jgi:hypothetical protein
MDTGESKDVAKRLQLPDVSGEAQPSPGGLPGSSHEVAGLAAAMATPQPTADARHRQIHPRDLLTYLTMATGTYPMGSAHPYPYPLGLNFTRRVTRECTRVGQ